mgnify:CR=1 FL=1
MIAIGCDHCSLVSLAEMVSEHTEHRMPRILLAAMEIPIPVVQIRIPRSHSPDATAFATLAAIAQLEKETMKECDDSQT